MQYSVNSIYYYSSYIWIIFHLITYPISDWIADNTKSIAKINPYENNEPVINFFPVLIFSSSPKLNFRIRAPEQTATAAAGVEIFIIQLSISSNAELSLETIFGSPKAKQ